MRGRSRCRHAVHAAIVVVAIAVLATACSVGPAANRAAEVDPSETPEQVGITPDDDDSSTSTPDDSSSSPTNAVPEPASPDGSIEGVATVASGITDACCLAELPDGDFLIGERQTGTIYRASQDGELDEVGTVTGITAGSGRGLLGLAAREDPSDENTIVVYVLYSGSTSSRISSYRYIPDPGAGQEQWGGGRTTLVDGIPYSSDHNGGALAFGPDGMLYAGTGDTGDPSLADDPDSLAGKILRIDPDTYTSDPPDDNPDQDSYVYSSGHTDVEGLAWDGADRLWAVDGTELNAIAPGGDYANQQDPVYDWSSSGSGSGSGSTVEPTGLAYDEGSRSLWMTSQTDSGIWRIPLNGQDGLVEGAEPELLADSGSDSSSDSSSDSNGQLSDARDLLPGDASGELLALTASASGGGAVLRVTVT